jgi:hypothetical protein
MTDLRRQQIVVHVKFNGLRQVRYCDLNEGIIGGTKLTAKKSHFVQKP